MLTGLLGEVEQSRPDPAILVRGITELELREDRVDVPLHRAGGDPELLADPGVAPALRDEPQDLALTSGQSLESLFVAGTHAAQE